MFTTDTKRLLAAFLLAGSSVYAGPALGAEGDEPVEAVDLFDAEAAPGEAPQVEVGNLGQVTITAKETDITMVLRILSMQSKRNIIASRNVSGTVSANLYQVDFYEALDAILQPNGFGYQEKGNFIYVKTLDEIKAEEDANRKKVHKLVRLNYLNAADAAAYVSPLLSSDGTISVSAEVQAGFQPSLGDGGANSNAHAETLIIRDYEENVDQINSLLAELDIQPEQVLIESTILSVRLTESNALGVDFAVYGDIGIDDITTPLGVVDNLISKTGAGGAALDSGVGASTSAGNTLGGQSGIKLGFLGSDASVFIRALDSVNDTNVLASPKMLVLNRQKAELLVGERLGYLSTTVTDTSETQTVEFLDVGVQLTARPFISSDGRVRMELRASLSDGDTTRVVDGNVIPQETAQEVVTNVIMRNGQTIVLGGLFKEDTGSNVNQLPGIGHVPGLGLLGKGKDDTIERSEVVFLIKPTIMKDEALGAMGDELYGRAIDSVVGARDNLLPWSRTKMTASHMAKAREHLEAGNKDKALWHVNLALHLDPTMVDAMRLKQELTGEPIFYYNRSMLNEVIDSVIDAEAGTVTPQDAEVLDAAMSDADVSAEAEAEMAEAEAEAHTAESLAEAEAIEAALAESLDATGSESDTVVMQEADTEAEAFDFEAEGQAAQVEVLDAMEAIRPAQAAEYAQPAEPVWGESASTEDATADAFAPAEFDVEIVEGDVFTEAEAQVSEVQVEAVEAK